MTEFITAKVRIGNSQGLHARPATLFVKLASTFESSVIMKKDGNEANGKSMMGVLTLAAEGGSVVELEVNGPDAKEAFDALKAFLTGEHEASEDMNS